MMSGDRIRQVRELLGWTQEELAKRIGTTQPVVAQLEAGYYGGKDLTAAISFKTGFPPSFFNDPYFEDFPLGSLQFRGHSKMMRRDRQQAYRYGQLLFEVYRRVSMYVRRQPSRLPQVQGSHIDAAIATRSAMGIAPDTPIKNLVNAAEQIGVVILGLPVSLEGRDAFSAWAGDVPVIIISAGRPGDRIRLTVAHELGHLVMHQAVRGTLKSVEKEAFSYGAELLMPQASMYNEILTPVTLTTLAPLKVKWKVSIQALIMRARELRIITERQSYYLFEQMGRSGFRMAEPENLAVAIEKPRALRQIIERRYQRQIDYKQLAADTNLTPKMLETIINAHAEGPSTRRPTAVSPFRRPSA